MDLTRLLLNTAWVPILSGCMMGGGIGHAHGTDWMGEAGYARAGQAPQPVQRAQASSRGLTISLSFPTPTLGDAVAIDAQLLTDGVAHGGIDGDVWLRIQTPGGAVDLLRMQRPQRSPVGAYRAPYGFPIAGAYLVTAEARTGTGSDERTVSVTASVQVDHHAQGGRHLWVRPAAVLGGLGMVATMALMMGGFWH